MVTNSSALKDSQNTYSPADCELLAVKFAASAIQYYLYGCPVVYVYTYCSSLDGIFAKPMYEIENNGQQKMIEFMQNYNYTVLAYCVVSSCSADLAHVVTKIRTTPQSVHT